MRILFIRPKPAAETIGLQHVMIVEPLELEILAGLVRSDDYPVIIDMILEKNPIEYYLSRENPDIICITGYITNIPTIIEYCKTSKKMNPDAITIVGGVHCEVCPADFNDNAIDFRVVRNATTVFPQLLNHIRGMSDLPAGVLLANKPHVPSELPPFDFFLPFPNRELTASYRSKYFYIFHDKVALIKTAFGCPYSCNFCFCRQITQGQYVERPLDEVMQELASIQEKKIYIVDDDFLTSTSRVMNFIKAHRTAHLDKQYLIYGRADFIAHHPDIMEQFSAIGLRTVIVGFESFFEHELEQYNKNIDVKTNENAMKILNRLGIDCYATIIVSPDWGKREFSICKKKCRALGIHYVNLQPLTPLPGTGQNVDENDLIISRTDYSKWDLAHVTIRPTKMSVADYYKSIIRLYNAILFRPQVLLRYVRQYNMLMLWKMIRGSYLVRQQYYQKIKEAKRIAENNVHTTDAVRRR